MSPGAAGAAGAPDELGIRPLAGDDPADRAALEAMAEEVVRAGEMFVYERVEDVLGYWLARGAAPFLAVDGAGRAHGTYVVKPNQPGRGSHVANAGYMVAEASRGRGLGRRLGEHSLETARALGYRAMQFNFVVATNAAALAVWEALGFRVVGTQPAAFRHDVHGLVDALILHRDL